MATIGPDGHKEAVKKKLTEAQLSDEVTPAAAMRIGRMLEELNKETVTEEGLTAMDQELADIMANLEGPSVDELKKQMVEGIREKGTTGSRIVPAVFGLFALGIGVFVILYFSGWWKYLAGGFLLVLGWASVKTSFTGSDKEIDELTTPETISDETKRKFQNRMP